MIKLAHTSNKVFVQLSHAEFKFMAKKKPSDTNDGETVSLLWIKSLIDNVTDFSAFIAQAKTAAETLATKLGAMLP